MNIYTLSTMRKSSLVEPKGPKCQSQETPKIPQITTLAFFEPKKAALTCKEGQVKA